MANTVFKIEHGLDVKNNANIAGNLSVAGNLNVSGNLVSSGTAAGDFIPIDSTYSLGNTTNRWNLLSNTVSVQGSTTVNGFSVSGNSIFSANIAPNANNIALGNTSRRWDAYSNNLNALSINVLGSATVNGTFTVNTGLNDSIVVSGNSTHSNITVSVNVANFGGNSNFDGGVLFVDATNNRVGINNTSPGSPLTISGNLALISGTLLVGSQAIINSSGNWVGPSSGVQGVQGAQGVQGNQGNQGIQGAQGVQGAQGRQGSIGAQGAQGFQGVQGAQGVQGTIGAQGFQGVVGAQGSQGAQGVQGASNAGTITENTSDNTYYPTFATSNTGSFTPNITSTKLNFNPYSGVLSATTFNSLSDITYKQNINLIDDPLGKLMRIDGIEFEWFDNHEKSAGVIAQQIEKVLPHLVQKGKNLGVNYDGLTAYLIEAIKQLNCRLNNLEQNSSKNNPHK